MKNIGLVLFLSRHGGGTYQWTINMLHTLEDYRKCHSGVRVHIFYFTQDNDNDSTRKEFQHFNYHKIGQLEVLLLKILRRIFIAVPFLVFWLKHIHPLNFISARKKIDLMIFPGATFDVSFYMGKQIFMFTDIAHVFYPHFPEVSAGGQLRVRHLLFKYGLKQADQIVVDSFQLSRDIVKFYNADISKVAVLYQTISQTINVNDEDDKECADFANKLPKKYLFYPAQLWQHKNHKNLLRALKFLIEEDHEICLILSGSRKKGDEQIFSLIEELKLQDCVKYLGYVPDKFMPMLYKNAQMLVMPTYFGPTNIPTLEAFYFGCPAIISDLPGVKEQTEDAVLLFNPDSPQDIANKVIQVLSNKDLRDEMIRKGHERVKFLSYENYRKKLFTILDKGLVK